MCVRKLIIVPAYNESQAIRQTLNGLRSINADVLVINDGSTDQTAPMAIECKQSNPRLNVISLCLNSGIGAAMQTGFLYAKYNNYEYAIQFDGDGQHSAESVEPLIDHAKEQGLDLCIGSRFLDIRSFTSSQLRQVGIRFFSHLIGILSGVRVTDPTSGFRIYSRQAITRFAENYPDDYPEPEALFWCARNGLKVGEYPVAMHERQGGQSSIRYFRTVYYMLKVSLAILIDRLRRKEC